MGPSGGRLGRRCAARVFAAAAGAEEVGRIQPWQKQKKRNRKSGRRGGAKIGLLVKPALVAGGLRGVKDVAKAAAEIGVNNVANSGADLAAQEDAVRVSGASTVLPKWSLKS
jgi:hypothetical protein